jgi:AcrR family transcriptional regulator
MKEQPMMAAAAAAKRPRGRPGRPPRELAGEVDERILDAARDVFLARGFEGASIDEIAQVARAGKPTIYARFAGKEALYGAVIARNVAANTRFEDFTLEGTTFEQRLINLSTAMLERSVNENTIGLMRISISEARRFPELARSVTEMARSRGADAIAKLLGEMARQERRGGKDALAPERIPLLARLFLDLIFFPILFRGLVGEGVDELRNDIRAHVTERVAFFIAASGMNERDGD